MIIDGRGIANKIKETLREEVSQRVASPTLFVILVGNNPVSEKFLIVKEKFAADIGVQVVEKRFSETIDTLRLESEVVSTAKEKNSALIVQLPLPQHIDTQKVLNAIPPHKDPDMLGDESVMMFKNGRAQILPPVIGAIKEILNRHKIEIKDKKIVVVGRGQLVGQPAETWFKREGGEVTVVDERTPDISPYTKGADIILSGAGMPGLIKPEIIKEGVVLLDAGTSEAGGKLLGDADPACAPKCSIFTPAPGGIGPITVAMLFKNLLTLTSTQ